MFRPTVSAIIRQYYDNIKGKIKEEASPLQYFFFKTEVIIFVPKNNEILQRRILSVGKCKGHPVTGRNGLRGSG